MNNWLTLSRVKTVIYNEICPNSNKPSSGLLAREEGLSTFGFELAYWLIPSAIARALVFKVPVIGA